MMHSFSATFQIIKQYITQHTPAQSKKNWVWYIVLFASFIYCYAKIIGALIKTWWNNDVYTHGFIVPLVSLYIIWTQRYRLKDISFSPSYFMGTLTFGTAILMLIIGNVSGVLLVQELSILVLIVGIVLFLFGLKVLATLWVPIVYLVFMLPFLRIFTDGFHFPFQVFSAKLATILLQAINIPSICYLNYIELPSITLDVAKGCSGINYLISVIALGFPLAYLTLYNWHRRIILVCGAVIIAILANGIRVFLIGVFSYYGISSILHGPYHILQALFVAIMGYIALFSGAYFLSRGNRPLFLGHSVSSQIGMHHLRIKKIPVIFISGVLIITGSFINFYSPSNIPLKMDFKLFPYEIGEWKGTDGEPEYEELRSLYVDSELSRTYRNELGKEVRLYIGYHGSQKQGKELVTYKSETLHTGTSKTKINIDPDTAIEVNKIIRREGDMQKLVLFWYEIDRRITANRFMVRVYTTWNAFSEQRTNGTIVMVSSDFYNDSETRDISGYCEGFIRDIMPVLRSYIP